MKITKQFLLEENSANDVELRGGWQFNNNETKDLFLKIFPNINLTMDSAISQRHGDTYNTVSNIPRDIFYKYFEYSVGSPHYPGVVSKKTHT
jgi:hypothetical protein